MKISIIIPVYNSEKYLEECIQSAIQQTYPSIEIIAINDGSTDSSLEILNKYSNKIIIINKENGGVASARNKGIDASTGDWIKLLDNDDVLYPDAVKLLAEEVQKLKDEKTVLYSHADFIDEQGKVIGRLLEPDNNSLNNFEINTILLDHSFGIPSTWLMPRSIFSLCGPFDEITEHDDYEFHLRSSILYNCRFHLLPKVTTKYRIHSKQFTWQVMRKYQGQDNIASSILQKLPDDERKKYEEALHQFRNNRSLFEKTAYFFRPVLKFLPIPVEIKLRQFYLKLVERQQRKKSQTNQ